MPESIGELIRRLRIVVGGMIGGLLLLSGVGVLLGPISNNLTPRFVIGMLAGTVFMGAAAAIGYVVGRRGIYRSLEARAAELRQQGDASAAVGLPYSQLVFVGGGAINGFGMGAGVVYLLTGHSLALSEVALAIALLVVHFPTESKLRSLAERATQS